MVTVVGEGERKIRECVVVRGDRGGKREGISRKVKEGKGYRAEEVQHRKGVGEQQI